jgi:hypothetical protein
MYKIKVQSSATNLTNFENPESKKEINGRSFPTGRQKLTVLVFSKMTITDMY